jgi:hypothetical protein
MKKALFVAGAMVTFFAALRSANAQGFDSGPGGAFSTPSGGMPQVHDTPPSGEKRRQAGNSIKLFDSYNTTKSYQLDVGPIWHRQIQDETPELRLKGFERGAPLASEIAIGMTFTTPQKPFYLFGRQRTILRIIDDKSFSWSVFHQDLGGGLMIGPLEPEAGIGLSVLTADIFHAEPSIQLLTPRVSAGVGIHVGKFRVDLKAHAEYLWRWFGPDYLIRGITLGIRLDVPRPASPYPESPQ